MVRGRPIVLTDGDYLLPIYHETGHDTERVSPDSASLFLRFDNKTKKWTQTERIRSANGNIQPAVVQLEGDHLLAFCRRGGGYEPDEVGYIVRSESRDGGQTWTKGVDTVYPNPNAAVDLIKLESGNLLMAYNHHMSERDPLALALSKDGGKTFPYRIDVAMEEVAILHILFVADEGWPHSFDALLRKNVRPSIMLFSTSQTC